MLRHISDELATRNPCPYCPEPDNSLFNGTITAPSTEGPHNVTWHPVRGKFDTGAVAPGLNLISREILQRTGLESLAQALDEQDIYEASGVDGKTHRLTEKISLTWQMNNSTRSYSTTFFVVAESAQFDLLLGNDFIRAQDALGASNRSLLFLGLRERGTGE